MLNFNIKETCYPHPIVDIHAENGEANCYPVLMSHAITPSQIIVTANLDLQQRTDSALMTNENGTIFYLAMHTVTMAVAVEVEGANAWKSTTVGLKGPTAIQGARGTPSLVVCRMLMFPQMRKLVSVKMN
jgi:hypothetical protein